MASLPTQSQHLHAQPHAMHGPLGVNEVGRRGASRVGAGPAAAPGAAGRPTGHSHQSPAPGRRAGKVHHVVAATEGATALLPNAGAHDSSDRRYSAADVFQCQEESLFYSQALEKLLPVVAAQDGGGGGRTVAVEFGTGDGSPVVSALLKTKFDGVIHGFELNPKSASLAQQHAAAFGVQHKYKVSHGCFFAGTSAPPARGATCLVANPPYLPAPDADILMPELHGGMDGAGLTRDLLSLGYANCMLLVASYSNPKGLMRHAASLGYRVVDFIVTPLPFGTYSSEPKVKSWIAQMAEAGTAHYSGNTYLLAGVLFRKAGPSAAAQGAGVGSKADLSGALLRVLTSLE